MTLTNREIASLIIFAVVVVFAIVKDRKGMSSAFLGLLRAAVAPRLLVLYLTYFAYAAAIVWLASLVELWDWDMLKDTIIIVFAVGFPLISKSVAGRGDGGHLLREAARATVGVSALVAFYINLEAWSLVGELFIQSVALLASGVAIVAAHQGAKGRPALRVAQIVLGVLGVILVISTALGLATRAWSPEQLVDLVLTFALSIWLPIALLPFAYVAGLIAAVETVVTLLPLHNDRKRPPLRVHLAIILGVRARLRYARSIKLQWLPRLATATTYRQARALMRDLRRETRAAHRGA